MTLKGNSTVEPVELDEMSSSALVLGTAKKAWEVIHADTDHIRKQQKWLVVGRIVQVLFYQHFHMAYTKSAEMLDKKDVQT